jgi:hypothetical protein
MKHLKRFNESETWSSGISLDDVVEFIQPSDPMGSDEYYYYIWGDDEAYYDKNLKVSDYMDVIKGTVFKEESNTAKKFGYDFIMTNQEEILDKCKEDLISAGIKE